MRTIILIILGIAVGWFVRAAIDVAAVGINDWRPQAKWAVFGVADIIAILLLFP